ncbi:MAG TPA: hypothetical protein VGM69_15085 [Chloroflexota bacterium]
MRLIDVVGHAVPPIPWAEGEKIPWHKPAQAAPTWRTAAEGLFSPRPHLRLDEAFWDEPRRVATRRYFVVDAETGSVERHAESLQAYSAEEYRSLLRATGFVLRGTEPSLDGTDEPGEFLVLVGEAR